MNIRNTTILSASIFLVACTTSVVDDIERELPEGAAPFGSELEMQEAIEQAVQDEVENIINEPEEDSDIIYADISQSLLTFTGAKGGIVSHEGKFSDFSFRMELDPENPTDVTASDILLTVQIGSMETDNEGLTQHLLSDDYFEAETYPEAQFISDSIVSSEGNDYTITGTLTMKSVEQSISFDAEITDSYLSMSTILDRTDYGIGPAPEGLKAIDAAIPVTAKIIFNR